MKFLRLFILTLAVGSALLIAGCERQLEGEDDLSVFAGRVMEAVVASDLAGAYAIMARHSVLPPEEVTAAGGNSVLQRDADFLARYGRSVGYEAIARKQMGDHLLRYTYLERTERHPLIWFFDFYKSPSGWVLVSFGWHDGVNAVMNGS